MKTYNELFEKFNVELYKYAELNLRRCTAEISIEENDYVFSVSCQYHYDNSKDIITYLDIQKAWFQFGDFEATLDKQYVDKIESVFNQ